MGNILLSVQQQGQGSSGMLWVIIVLLALLVIILWARTAKAKSVPEDRTELPAPVAVSSGEEEDEQAIVAAIAAAVAMIAAKEGTRLSIRSYRRIGTQAPAWNRAGRYDAAANRF